MVTTIKAHYEAGNSPEDHDRLMRRAQQARINRGESIEAYIKKQRTIRTDMVRANYPGIQDERTTVMFIVRGLQARPSIAHHVSLLLTQRHRTMKDVTAAIELLETLDKPRTPRGHTPNWRARIYNQYQPQSPPGAWRDNTSPSDRLWYQDRGTHRGMPRRGRGRGRGAGSYRREANATRLFQPRRPDWQDEE